MFKNKKNILKYGKVDEALPGIAQIKNKIPQWYKDAYRFQPGKKPFQNQAIKLCMPFLDALTSGYCVELMQDIVVERKGSDVEVYWPEHQYKIIEKRPSSSNPTVPTPPGCDEEHYVWILQTAIELPRGYSAMFTHPMNRYDLPFITMSGIVDADGVMGTGNLPFFLRSDFEGIIPAGTPIVQIIPFKREDWSLKYDPEILIKGEINSRRSKSHLYGWYKKNLWHKKTFE